MQTYATSTGSLAAGGQTVAANINAGITAVQLVSDGTNAATLAVYEGSSASGVMIANVKVPAAIASVESLIYAIPVCANKGVFTVLTGTGASFIIHYAPL